MLPTLSDLVTPSKTAVLVVDVQNDFCEPAGAAGKNGKDTSAAMAMIPVLQRFLAAAREHGTNVIFIQTIHEPSTDSDAWVGRRANPGATNCLKGTWGADFTGIAPLSTERILTMSFIEGTKILSTPSTRSDPKRVARLGLATLLKMIFEDGFVHADLHPGNIFITPDDKLALLDLGLVGELDEPHRKGFARFFAAWAQRDGDAMAHIMYGLSESAGTPRDPEAFERYRAAIIEFVGRFWGYRLGQVQVGKVLLDMLGILRRHRVRVNASFTIVNIAIAVTEGIGKQLDPELDLMSEALPYFLAHPVEATGGTGGGTG